VGPISVDSLIRAEDELRSTALLAEGTAPADRAAAATRDLLDEVISHIHRAGLLINTCRDVVGPPLVKQLVHLAGELDALIDQLQADVFERHGSMMLTEFPSPLVHWAWSEGGRRWVNMTFDENQAWLARPDLDPVTFAGWTGR
jgi:hypothetical protein